MSSQTGDKSWGRRIRALIKQDLHLEVRIEQHDDSTIYTSGSTIAGCATITSQRDMAFDAVDISLTGTAFTCLIVPRDDFCMAKHPFLRLDMPVPMGTLPESGVFQAGQIYSIPLLFIIPVHLPSTACKFPYSATAYEKHLQLPPTLGSWDGKDQAPHAAQIGYAIEVRVVSKLKSTAVRRQIKVVPLSHERPLPYSRLRDARINSTDCKMIRQTLLSPQIGHLRASATQPDAFVLSVDQLKASGTSMRIDLEFSPKSSDILPPDVQAKSAHIQTVTHYSSAHISYVPDQGYPAVASALSTPYIMSHELVVTRIESVRWGSQETILDAANILGSEETNTTEDGAAGYDNTPVKYKAAMMIHISPPSTSKKLYLPSFYSCLICRTYTIRLVLAAGTSGTCLSLSFPLQVAAAKSPLDGMLPTLPEYAEQDPARSSNGDMLPQYGDLPV